MIALVSALAETPVGLVQSELVVCLMYRSVIRDESEGGMPCWQCFFFNRGCLVGHLYLGSRLM